jgi:hypothetical protein
LKYANFDIIGALKKYQRKMNLMTTFTHHSLYTINQWLNATFKKQNELSFIVLNPDFSSKYSGEKISIDNTIYCYRGYKAWVNLAELHHAKMLTPKIVDEYLVRLTFQKLETKNSFHTALINKKEEKYGTESKFFKINKNEEPTFLLHYQRALEAVKVGTRKQILNLGINKGDEFELIEKLVDKNTFNQMKLIGVDHSQTALEVAKQRFPKKEFFQQDINRIEELNLGQSNLIISIGTLQSPSINYKLFLQELVQKHLTKTGAFILGFPNSRWIDHELIYGAKAPNYPYSEMSLLYNDVIFAKKYLQQKKFRVTLTGREYIFLTATSIRNH